MNVIILPLLLVTLISFCNTFPRPDGSDSDNYTDTHDANITVPGSGLTNKLDGPDADELRCFSPEDSFDPVNLYTEDSFLDGGGSDDNSTQDAEVAPSENGKVVWRKLQVNKYYGVLRDRFYVRNTEGLISLQLRDGEPLSSASLMGMESDWHHEYILAKADIYYSASKHYGAMHAIRGETYAFELQFVHFQKQLGNLEDAATVKHGILVVCVLFESTGKQNPYMDPLVAAAIMSVFPTDKLHVAHGPLDIKALLPSDLSNLQYTGLYVNQPCAREAKFVVLMSTRQVSEKQLKKFREIRGSDGQSNTGVFGEFMAESVRKGVAVTVSKNVRIQIVKKEVLSNAERNIALDLLIAGFVVNLLALF